MRYQLTIALIFFFRIAFAQLEIIDAPKEGAFLAQNPNSKTATYLLRGKVNQTAYTSLFIKVYQSGTLIMNKKVNLNWSGGIANFKQMVFMPGGKYIYRIVYQLRGSASYNYEIDDIVVGDVYIIQGQSNAVAASYNKFDPSYYDKYCRSFGTSSRNVQNVSGDTNWYRTYADGAYNRGSVGQWGAVMAKVLVDSFHTPICIMNGAVGGTRITQHQVDTENRENLQTIYGRLLYRMRKAKLDQKVRGILYFQGESDGPFADLHDTLFQKLHGEWKKDYPGFEKLFVIQVRSGCGRPSIQLRDKQRMFEKVLPNCQTVSANGLNNHDGCHYGFANGYELLGHQMAALVGRDYYGSKRDHINPPNVRQCYYSNSKQTELTLEMKYPSDSIFVDKGFTSLFKIEGDPSVSIISGLIRNNKLVLSLDKSSCQISGLTYDGFARSQPWVKGGTGMGLVSFYNIPIELQKPQDSYMVCKNVIVTLGSEEIKGCKYLWKDLKSSRTYTRSKFQVMADKSTDFLLEITYESSACVVKDSSIIKLNVDPIQIPNLGKDQLICNSESVVLKPDNTNFAQFVWNQRSRQQISDSLKTSQGGQIQLTATSSMGCNYSDTVEVLKRNPFVELPKKWSLCLNGDTLMTVADTFAQYAWNGTIGSKSKRVSAGRWRLTATDSFGCLASDSTEVLNYPTRKELLIEKTICDLDSFVVNKPNDAAKWFYQSNKLGTEVIHKNSFEGSLDIVDTNGCETSDSINLSVLDLPKFELGEDTGFCWGDEIQKFVTLDEGDELIVNDSNVIEPNFIIRSAGLYRVERRNAFGCIYRDSVLVNASYPISLDAFYDTLLCEDSTWLMALSDSVQFLINGEKSEGLINFDSAGIYKIQASNEYCSAIKTIEVKFQKCGLGIRQTKSNSISIIPNPFKSFVRITSDYKLPKSISVFDAQGKLIKDFKASGNSISLALEELNSGVYFLQVGSQTRIIVKQD